MRASLEKYRRSAALFRAPGHAEFDIAQFGVLRYLVMSAATVDDALVSLARYISICVSVIHCRIERQPSHILLHFDCASSSLDDGSPVEVWMLRVSGLIGMLLGQPFHPIQVAFHHGPHGDRGEYYKRFGCPALFRQKNNSLVLSPTTLKQSCTESDPTLHSIMRFYFASLSSSAGQLQNQVVEYIFLLMPAQRATLVNVAQALGVNPRTLQRRLAADETDFEDLLDGVRRQQALKLLQHPHMGIGEIASALGYRRTGSFCRAYQRWFGITPVKYRNQCLAQMTCAEGN